MPLANMVASADLAGCALSVEISGKPVAHLKSYFAGSKGNEVARNTGGGIISHTTQGKAYFLSGSPNVLIEGEPAVRSLDLLTANHLSRMPGNTPPTPWLSSVDMPLAAPLRTGKSVAEGKERIEIHLLDETGGPLEKGQYEILTPAGTKVTGNVPRGGQIVIAQLSKGDCKLVLPLADQKARESGQKVSPKTKGEQQAYQPSKALSLSTGKTHTVVVPYMRSLWVDLPVRVRDPDAQDDKFVLSSKDRSYEVTRTIADDRERGDLGLTLEFCGLQPGGVYTLRHDQGPNLPTKTVFEDVPFEELFPESRPRVASRMESEREIDAPNVVGWQAPRADLPEPTELEIELHPWPPPGEDGSPAAN